MNPEKLRDTGAEINAKVTVIHSIKNVSNLEKEKDSSKRGFQNPK